MHRALLVAHVLVHHQQPEAVAQALDTVAAREALQVRVGIVQQDVERELLREVAELLAVGRSDQLAELLPGPGPRGLDLESFADAGRALQPLVVLRQFQSQARQRIGRRLQPLRELLRQPFEFGRIVDLAAPGFMLAQHLRAVLQHGLRLLHFGIELLQRLALAGDRIGRGGQQGRQLG